MFIGREVEMERLRRMYDSPNQEVVLIYGRRRIGKSELIKQFLKTSKIQGLYYQCKRGLSVSASGLYGHGKAA